LELTFAGFAPGFFQNQGFLKFSLKHFAVDASAVCKLRIKKKHSLFIELVKEIVDLLSS
jgi:hypothetical protein